MLIKPGTDRAQYFRELSVLLASGEITGEAMERLHRHHDNHFLAL